jgi:hypothetical protein
MNTRALLIVTVSGLCGANALAQNTGAQLTSGSSVYDVTSTGAAGTIPTTTEPGGTSSQVQGNFRVTGGTSGIDNVYANWWWYRVNGSSTRELGIRQSSGTAVRTLTGTNSVTYNITTGGFQFDVNFTLTNLSATASNILTSVRVNNNTGADADVSLFNMLDLFLGGQDANDRVTFAGLSGGDRAINFDDSVLSSYRAQFRGFGASGYGVGTFSTISSQVTDTGIDNFNDVTGSVGPDDLSAVMQFNVGVVPAGGSVTVYSALAVDVQGNAVEAVPAPASLALLGLGGLVAARRRR